MMSDVCDGGYVSFAHCFFIYMTFYTGLQTSYDKIIMAILELLHSVVFFVIFESFFCTFLSFNM